MSALSIPPVKQIGLRDAIDSVWDVMQNATEALLPIFRQSIPKVRDALKPYSDQEVLEAIEAKRSHRPLEQGPLRTAEFRQFISAGPEVAGVLPPVGTPFY